MLGMITDDDIRRVVTRNAFEHGLEYQLDGRVQLIRAAPDGSLIEAHVRGGARAPYRQTIRVAPGPGGKKAISGACSCPVGFNCKHVAAALLAYQEQNLIGSQPKAERLADRSLPAAAPKVEIEAPIPPEVDAWLRRLEAAQQDDTDDYPPTVRKRLLYLLHPGNFSGAVIVELYTIDLNRARVAGGPGRRYRPPRMDQPGLPEFLRPTDRTILRHLQSPSAVGSADFIGTLRNIVATGRGRWGAAEGPVLTEGEPARGQVVWSLLEDGRQRAALQLPEGLLCLRLAVPWYVNPATGAVGPVETDLAPAMLQAMLSSPALSPSIAARVRGEIARRWPDRAIPTPVTVAPPRQLREKLQPRLELLAGELPFDSRRPPASPRDRVAPTSPGTHSSPLARLSWRYGPVTLTHSSRSDVVTHDGVLLQINRDPAAETRAKDRLRGLGFAQVPELMPLPPLHRHVGDMILIDPDPGAWFDFMLDDLPELRKEGWQIDIAADFPLRLASPDGEIFAEIREGSGIDWFDLDLGVMVDSARVNLVPALLKLIADPNLTFSAELDTESGDPPPPLLLPLPDGRFLIVPFARLQPILAPLLELFAVSDTAATTDAIRLSRRHLGDLALLEAASASAGFAWSGGEALRALGRQLREHGSIPPCPTPAGFGASLRAYQQQGLAWLQFLRTAGLGGILADDMGLGKTVQTLAHLTVEQVEGRLNLPALIICPTSLVANWRAEAMRFAPTLSVLVLHGPARAESFAEIPRHDLVITTYPLLTRDHAVLVAQEWHVIVLDEAQTIKNPLANISKLARTFQARQRLCLSGTPLENHLGELWSLFDFLSPGFLGDRQQFGRRFRAPIEKGGNTERRVLLTQRIAPFLLRRTKNEVAADLPPKTEITEPVEMGEHQRAVYEGIRLAMHAKVRAAIAERGLARSGIVILEALLKLRQACCDPRLLNLKTAKAAQAGSAKLDRLLEMLPPLLEEGRRVLLFSQFTSMLALIEAELTRLAIPYVLLTGDTRDRKLPVQKFQNGEVPLFLISLKAGGVGLNLTAADTIIHYDPWWNPAVENQATDRAHRIGQDKPVFVHRLVTMGSIEEKMEILKQRKQALVDGILGATSGAALALSEGDIEMLFAPIGSERA